MRRFALILALACWGALARGQDAAPDREFDRIAEHVSKDAPSQDLVDRIYAFMEKYPKDPRSDRLQYWVGIVQQKRKFHHEAIKELGFVLGDFPSSPLILPALRAQAQSYQAIGDPRAALACYRKIIEKRPPDLAGHAQSLPAVHDALLALAHEAIRQKDIDGAAGYYLQLPDRSEALARTVELYIEADRHEDAMTAIGRLKDSDRFLAYRLSAQTYAARPGVANLKNLLSRIIEKEKPQSATDAVIEQIIQILESKDAPEHAKALELVSDKYPRLRRWARFELCEQFKASQPDRLRTFIGDFRTGNDVEKTKTWLGEYYEAAGEVKKAQEAYWLLDDKPEAHFRVAETYYGQRARVKDLPAGQAELTAIVRRFYSPAVSATALSKRAELEAGPMKKPATAIATLIELVDRFPREGTAAQAALMRLGHLYRQEKKPDDAIRAYEKLITEYPNGPYLRQAWLGIASTYEEKKEPKRAIDILRSVLRKYPRTWEASEAHTRLETVYHVPDTDVSDR